MADHQKIHPVRHDLEAPQTPTAPLVPRGASKSDQSDPAALEEKYVPPPKRTIPVTHSRPPKRRSSCCKCMCWTVSFLVLLVIIIGAVVGILFLVFQPKIPKFSVDKLQVTQYNSDSNSDTLSATFDLTVTTRNPNKHIGIYYVSGSRISVWYTDKELVQGALPVFYQGHRNTTVLNLTMSGTTQNATVLLSTIQQQQQSTGSVPLTIKANQPVKIKLGKLKLFKIRFRVRCTLLVDSLTTENQITIASSSCKFRPIL
ncbi:Protein YLS9 [Morella rubra]|uniref:Protein YLS9 n=1 Tax=Morella rubra TaxID=262757 RepID=A0A6A1VJ91_9ROSI|nr:Protein YLS9 [Morella rubra]